MDNSLLESDVQAQLHGMQAAIDGIVSALEPILSRDPKEVEALPPQIRFEFHLGVASSLQSLFSLYLRCLNISPEQHEVAKDLERLEAYWRKLPGARAPAVPRTGALDVAAANRFIEHAMPELTAEQRAKLRSISSRAAAPSGGAAAKGRAPERRSRRRDAAAGSGQVGKEVEKFLEDVFRGAGGEDQGEAAGGEEAD